MLTLGAIDESPRMSAPVYLDYTQSELDRAFDQAQWAPNLKTLVARWAETSRAVRESSSGMQTRSYGTWLSDGHRRTQRSQRGGEEGMSASCCLLTDVFVSPLLVAGER